MQDAGRRLRRRPLPRRWVNRIREAPVHRPWDRSLEQCRGMYQAEVVVAFLHVPGLPLLVHTNTESAKLR